MAFQAYAPSSNCPWKLTISRVWKGSNSKKSDERYLTHDKRYKSYTRWEHKLSDVSNISHLKVEPSESNILATNASFTVVLKIRGIQEKTMGTIDVVSPVVTFYAKPCLGSIKKADVYCKVYLYEKPSGISGTRAYQSAADDYDIFMGELKEIWRKQLEEKLIKEKMIQNQAVDPDGDVDMDTMYSLLLTLHKRCKSANCWLDMKKAYNNAFGETDTNTTNNNNNNTNRGKNWSFGGNNNANTRGFNMAPTQNQQFTAPKSIHRYNLRKHK